MTVVDVDTHWEAEFGPGEHPLEPWREALPTGVQRLAFAIAGDLLDALPPERRPTGATLLPTFVRGLLRLANTQRIHAAQNLLVSLLSGGVFERHPTLTVMLQELKIGWLPSFLAMCSRQSASSVSLGEWPFSVSGGDMLKRNLRFTPLPGFGDVEVCDVLDELPEMALFSSDYPHQEGNADPINLYGERLDAFEPARRAAFLRTNALDMYARMGDPL